MTSRLPDTTRSRVDWYEPSPPSTQPSYRLRSGSSSCSSSGDGNHTFSVSAVVNPLDATEMDASPPPDAVPVATAVQPETVSTPSASLAHAAETEAYSVPCGRVLTV